MGELLHLAQVLKSVSAFCYTAEAANRIGALKPIADRAQLDDRFHATGELVQVLERKLRPPISQFPDLATIIRRLELHGSVLSVEELHSIQLVLRLVPPLKKFFKDHAELPYWQKITGSIEPHTSVVTSIDQVIDDDLTIKSSASKTLARIRRNIASKEGQVRKRLGKIHAAALSAGWGQEEPIAWREGRLVIALKSTHKRKLKGLIHGHSGSGGTAFVEPLEVFEVNNEITALREDERAEEYRLLMELTKMVEPHAQAFAELTDTLYTLDVHLAIASWSYEHKAVKPTLTRTRAIEIIDACNPVLADHREVVPLSLALDENQRMLLISGPNAGGKTVVLLTVGLLVAMAQCGLFVPAKVAKLPLCHEIYADLGDRQSLENDLSTFSAHLANLKEIVANSDETSLVLLDELGTGTDPEAGAALGQTFLEEILKNGALCLATTHLNRLKLWAQEAEGLLNGGMEFDPDGLRPTYRLKLGHPGASYALEIAKRMGLDQNLLDRAATLLPDAAVNLEELLVGLEEERARVHTQLEDNRKRDTALAHRESRITKLEEEVKAVHRSAKKTAIEEAEQMVAAYNKRLEGIVAEIRAKADDLTKDDIRKAKATIRNQRDSLKRQKGAVAEKIPQAIDITKIAVGDWVELAEHGSLGQVEKIQRAKGRVSVNVNGTAMNLAAANLLIAAPPEAEKEATQSFVTRGSGMAGSVSNRLDLRGMRGDEAVALVEQSLDRAILGGIREMEIIHGKGTGILQKLVRELLDQHPSVTEYDFANFEAGGTGVTIAKLK